MCVNSDSGCCRGRSASSRHGGQGWVWVGLAARRTTCQHERVVVSPTQRRLDDPAAVIGGACRRQIPPADRARYRRSGEGIPGEIHSRHPARERTRRSSRQENPCPHHRPLRRGKRKTVSRSHPTNPSPAGAKPSPTHASAQRSSTDSPMAATASKPAPSPTASPTPKTSYKAASAPK
jgi:hypothetical protein